MFDLAKKIESDPNAEHMRVKLDELNKTMLRMPGNFSVRNDSKLAWQVLQGKRTGDLRPCIDMAAVQLLYSQPDYRITLELRMRHLADCLKQQYPGMPYRKIWPLVRQYGTHIVKLIYIADLLLEQGATAQ
jgi:hypothetical protein